MSHKWHKPLNAAVSLLFVFGMVGFTAASVGATSAHHPSAAQRTVIFSDWQFPTGGLNPLQTSAVNQNEQEYLTNPFGWSPYFDPRGHLLPGYLTRVPTLGNGISRDGKTIKMNLRHGLKWSDGKPVTFNDFLFLWRVESDPATGPACAGSCDNIASVSVSNKGYSMTWHMKRRYAPAIPNAFPGFLPYHWGKFGSASTRANCLNHGKCTSIANVLENAKFNYQSASYVQTGPYHITSFTTNDRITYALNKYYAAPQGVHPKIKNLTFVWYGTKDAMILAGDAGQTDVMDDFTIADLAKLTSKTYHVAKATTFNPEILAFNSLNSKVSIDKGPSNVKNPVANVNVRLALSMNIDRIGLIESSLNLVGHPKTAESFASYEVPLINTPITTALYADKSIKGSWDPYANKYITYGKKAIADGKKLLAKAGYKHGLTVYVSTTVGNPTREAEFGVIKQNWAHIGVNAQLLEVPQLFDPWKAPGEPFGGTLIRGRFEVALHAYVGASPDPDNWTGNVRSDKIARIEKIPPGGTPSALDANEGGIRNATVDKGMKSGAAALSPSSRARDYAMMEKAFMHNAYWACLYVRPNIWTADKHVGSVKSTGFQYAGTWNTYEWTVR
jgi:ABC-type transport system substrate-binding protein